MTANPSRDSITYISAGFKMWKDKAQPTDKQIEGYIITQSKLQTTASSTSGALTYVESSGSRLSTLLNFPGYARTDFVNEILGVNVFVN